MHHCKISGGSQDVKASPEACRQSTLWLKILQLAVQEGNVWFGEIYLGHAGFTRCTTDVPRLIVIVQLGDRRRAHCVKGANLLEE